MNMKANMEAFLDSESGVINRKEDLKIQPQEGDENTPASRYVQALGPLRMSFVEGFGQGQHSFRLRKACSAGTSTRTLFREFRKYQYSLPVSPSSTILVRVQESCLNLVRFLVTGTSLNVSFQPSPGR
jgi:hypothetical protein